MFSFNRTTFFPSSLMGCIASPVSAIPQRMPMKGPHRHSACWQVTCRATSLDIHACGTLLSGFEKFCFGPKMVSETIAHPLNSRDFLGGACPHTLIYTPTGHFKYDGYGAEVYTSAVFCHITGINRHYNPLESISCLL